MDVIAAILRLTLPGFRSSSNNNNNNNNYNLSPHYSVPPFQQDPSYPRYLRELRCITVIRKLRLLMAPKS